MRDERVASRLATLLLVAALLAGIAATAQAAKDDLVLVSRATGASGAAGNAGSYYPSISRDGRWVAFGSAAGNLSEADDDAFADVFVRDAVTNTVIFVSRATGSAGTAGDSQSQLPSLSAEGRFVAFESAADNLSAEDDDTVVDVFVRDLEANTTTYVSRATGATGAAGGDHSRVPSVSSDGRLVAFESVADNLSAEDNNAVSNVFVRDLQANTTTYVSRAGGAGGAAGDGDSRAAAISADGRFVAFHSDADSLSAEDDNTVSNVFVRDLQTSTTVLASRASGAAGTAGDGGSYRPAISADGRFVAFDSGANSLSGEDNDAAINVFVRDLQANTTSFASRASGVAGTPDDGGNYDASISGDGRFVSFYSDGSLLSADDDDTQENVFVRDLEANTTTFVSRASGPSGTAGDGFSTNSSISGDGRFVAFDSEAASLSGDDNDAVTDVFLRDVLGPPTSPSPGEPEPAGADPPPAGGGGAGEPRRPGDAVDEAVRVSRFALSERVFRKGGGLTRPRAGRRRAIRTGTTIRFTLSEPATVTLAFERARPGRRVGRRCRMPTRRLRGRRRCTVYLRVRPTIPIVFRSGGAKEVRFAGRLDARRSLRRGRHRLTMTARDSGGNTSDPQRATFRLLPPEPRRGR